MSESKQREAITRHAKSIFDRGLTAGSSGNISVRTEDGGWLMTPTGSSMGNLDPAKISKLDKYGSHLSGDKPTKEAFLHACMYKQRPNAGAIVHLHSTHSTAVSCLACAKQASQRGVGVIPPLTAYFVMRVGDLPVVPYHPPGDINLAKAVEKLASDHHAVLLANHGPVVAGQSLEEAVFATEELEETAKLYLLTKDMEQAPLTDEQVAEIKRRYPVRC